MKVSRKLDARDLTVELHYIDTGDLAINVTLRSQMAADVYNAAKGVEDSDMSLAEFLLKVAYGTAEADKSKLDKFRQFKPRETPIVPYEAYDLITNNIVTNINSLLKHGNLLP